MKKLEGWTTIIGNVILGIALLANMLYGTDTITEEEAGEISAAVIGVITVLFNIMNRFRTKGPIFEQTPDATRRR